MSEWDRVEISEVCDLIVDCVNKTAPVVDYATDFKMLRTTNIRNGRVDTSNCRFVTKEVFQKWTRRSELKKGDVLLTREAPIGEVGMVKSDENLFLGQRLMQYRANLKKLDPHFLLYSFLSRDLQYQFGMHEGTGSVVSHIRVGDCFKFKISLPPLPEQKAIAHILGTLDEKIELNRKMNQTLEAMAQALFKSWFVDFDPVIDNALAEGNDIPEELQARAEKRKSLSDSKKLLSTNPSLAAQFPASFVFNETLGKWIPEGWEVKKVEEIATVVGGGTPSTKFEEYFTDNGIPWLSPKDLSGYEWKFIRKGATDITELGLKNSGAKLMPAGSVLFSSRAPIGYMAIAENEICTNQGFKSLVPDKGVPTEYLYQLLKSNADKIEAVATGSTFKEVSGSALKGIEVLVPSSKLLVEFSEKLKPSSDRQLTNQKETETLTQLRDRLLPELISGRVRVM